MRLTCMLAVSVTYALILGRLYPRVSGYNIFFLRFCLPFTHKRRFCVFFFWVLGPVHTVSGFFWKQRNLSPCFQKKKNKIKMCVHTQRIWIAFSSPHENANIFAPLRLYSEMIHTTPRLVSVSTKYVTTDLDDGYSGSLSITVAVECWYRPTICLSVPTPHKPAAAWTPKDWV